jgi:mRNA interferase MazF
VDVRQREIWLADLREPLGSEAGYRRPVVVIQSDRINVSRLPTHLCVPITGFAPRLTAPWTLTLSPTSSGLGKESLAQTHLLLTVNRSELLELLGEISPTQLRQLFNCLDIALGRA